MKLQLIVLPPATLLSGVLAVIPLSNVQRRTSGNLLPNTFIVELESISDLVGEQSPNHAHDIFYSELATRGGNFTVRHEFNQPDVFVGASITLLGDQDLGYISRIPGVKDIRPVVSVSRPSPLNKLIPMGQHDAFVPVNPVSTHVMTGVDKLHDQSLFGNGMRIGILDTGTDYTHPALGAGFGAGKKIGGGFDFVGDDFNGANTPQPDSDPLDQCDGHGTHVAGIIGANPDNDYGVAGVAYESTLFSYRIFGCSGSSTDDIVIAALLRGNSDGMDVISLSFGSADGWTESVSNVVASRLADQGKIITVAAGNEGGYGAWYSSRPSNGIDVISTASVDNIVPPSQNNARSHLSLGGANQLSASKNATATYRQTGSSLDLAVSTGGLISAFSQYGPTYDLFFKPAIAAPGGNILSTYPVPLGSYAVLSGTSMAAPFVAGCSALLLEAKGRTVDVARQARTLFQTTAQKVPSSGTDGDPLQTLTVQGAGLINAYNAINYKTMVSPGEILLNDTAHFIGSHTITVQNNGMTSEIYTVSHVPAGTAITIRPGTIFASSAPVPLTTAFAIVQLSSTILTIPAGDSATFRATFSMPTGDDKQTFPVYTGFIQIESSTESLHVAYQGVAAAMKDMVVLDNTEVVFGPGVMLPTLLDSRGVVQTDAIDYTFTGTDLPTLLFRLAAGTPKLVVDLVGVDVTLNKREVPSYWTPLIEKDGSFGRLPTVGPLAEFDYQPRSSDSQDQADGGYSTLALSAKFANNTAIPKGKYRVLMRALKITGDPSNEDDYEKFLSPIIGVSMK